MTRQQEILEQMNAMRRREQYNPASVTGWQNHLANMVEQKTRHPIAAPVAQGTPTHRSIEADRAHSRWQQEFAADERHRRQQLALQGAGGGAGGRQAPALQVITQGAVAAVNSLINQGKRIDKSEDAISRGLGVQYEPMTKEDAVSYIGRLLNEEGLTSKDYDEVMAAVYRAAGLSIPGTAERVLEDNLAKEQLEYLNRYGYEKYRAKYPAARTGTGIQQFSFPQQ